jgi:hypothetical protein
MWGGSVLELAIGVIFVYLVLSLVCTAVNEAIATMINRRGKNLFEGVKNLLNDPLFTGLAHQVYNHGLVDGLSRENEKQKANRLPSYMPSKTFSLALLDILSANGVVDAAHGELLLNAEKTYDDYRTATNENKSGDEVTTKEKAWTGARETLKSAARTAQTNYEAALSALQSAGAAATNAQREVLAQAVVARDKATAALKILDARVAAVDSACSPKQIELTKKAADTLEQALAIGRALAAGVPNQLDAIQAAVGRLPSGHTKESLLVLIDKSRREVSAAEKQVAHFQASVEAWFDDAMARVGGWYKRWTQKILLACAFVFVVLLNVDTVVLIQRFSSDKDLRAAVVAMAEKASAAQDVGEVSQSVDVSAIPLGWTFELKDPRCVPWKVEPGSNWAGRVFLAFVLKILGLLISVGAVSLGAPFWFDTLSKAINIRGAGTPPGEARSSAPRKKA